MPHKYTVLVLSTYSLSNNVAVAAGRTQRLTSIDEFRLRQLLATNVFEAPLKEMNYVRKIGRKLLLAVCDQRGQRKNIMPPPPAFSPRAARAWPVGTDGDGDGILPFLYVTYTHWFPRVPGYLLSIYLHQPTSFFPDNSLPNIFPAAGVKTKFTFLCLLFVSVQKQEPVQNSIAFVTMTTANQI